MDARQRAKEWLIAQTGVLDLLLDALLPPTNQHQDHTTNNTFKAGHISQSQDLIKQLGKPGSHDHVVELLNRAFENHSLIEKLAHTIYQAASALVSHDETTKSAAKLLRPARSSPLRRKAPAAQKPAAPDAFSIVGSHTALVTTPAQSPASPARPPMQAKKLAPLSAEAASRAGSPASLIVEPRPRGDASLLRAKAPASPSPGASGKPKTACPPPHSSGAGNHPSPPPAVPLLSISKEYDTVSSRSPPSPARTQLSPTPMSDADRRHLQSLYDMGAIEPDHPAARHLSYIRRQRSGARIGGAAPNLADLTMRGVASG